MYQAVASTVSSTWYSTAGLLHDTEPFARLSVMMSDDTQNCGLTP